LICGGISPLTFRALPDAGDNDDMGGGGGMSAAFARVLEDSSARILALEELYHKLGDSWGELKVKCAVAMGLHHQESQNLVAAEQLFFEALFLAERSQSAGGGGGILVTELGQLALIRCSKVQSLTSLLSFGDTLLALGKYRYAIAAFECAVSVHKVAPAALPLTL
jgi:hypothetical protein